MKNVKLVDALPTVFGLIAVLGLGATAIDGLNSGFPTELSSTGTLAMWGGAAISLIASLASVAGARQKGTKLYLLNIGWLLASGLFVAWTLLIFFTWGRFLGNG